MSSDRRELDILRPVRICLGDGSLCVNLYKNHPDLLAEIQRALRKGYLKWVGEHAPYRPIYHATEAGRQAVSEADKRQRHAD